MHEHHEHTCACGHCHAHDQEHYHEHTCACGHDHPEAENSRLSFLLYGAAVLLFVVGFMVKQPVLNISLAIAAVLLAGYDVLWFGFKSLFKLHFNEQLLLSIAVVAALILGETVEAVAVLLLFKLGEFLEEYAIHRSQREIDSLMELQADYAHRLLPDGTIEQIEAGDCQVGDTLIIRAGEKVPVDCVVLSGTAAFDTASVTGESVPQTFATEGRLLSGMIALDGAVTVKATALFENSTASKIIELVRMGKEKKGTTQKLTTRFAAIYTPVIMILAVLVALLPPLFGGDWTTWIMRSLIFLVASCPCAIVISVPLAFFSALGSCSKSGILIKGTKDIEALARVKTVVFDKTGTLTTGKLSVTQVDPVTMTETELLALAAAVERQSAHPIATAITTAAGETAYHAENAHEIAGKGIVATVNGQTVLCGTKRFLEENQITLPATEGSVYIAVDGTYVGALTVEDTLRPESVSEIETLKKVGVKQIAMLTGDTEKAAAKIAAACGIATYYSRLLPSEKCDRLQQLQKNYGTCAFVGDGINDAPVLTQSDVGIAPAVASDIAAGAADVILTGSDLSGVAHAIRVSRRTMGVVRFNFIFALLIKVVVLTLDLLGFANMWSAVLADVGVTLIAIFVAASLLSGKKTFFGKNKKSA